MGRPPCCDKANVKRGLWTAEEDAKILAYVSNHGIGNWTQVPKKAGLNRCGKSCRLRWTNYLRPDLKHEEFTQHEEELIVEFHAAIGSRWSLIAKQLPGRTDNDVKNYWNTKLKKKLAKMGIDPITHKPILKILSDYETITSLTTNHQMKEKNESLANSCTTQPKINRLLVQGQFQNTSSSSNNRLLFHLSQFELVDHGSFNHCNLQEISPSSSSSSSSSISNGKSSSHLIINEPSSPTVVNTTASCNWGEASFNEHLLTIDNMEVECNYQKLAPTLDMSMQCKLTSANYMNNYVVDMSKCEDVTKSIEVINNYEPSSSVNSFVKNLLERDCQMQQDFPIFEDILDY